MSVGTLIGLVASGKTVEQILALHPYVEAEDTTHALRYAAWRVEEIELPLAAA